MTIANLRPRLLVELDPDTSKVRVMLTSGLSDQRGAVQIADLALDSYSDEQTRFSVLGKVLLDSLQALAGQRDADSEAGNDEFFRREVEPRARAGDVEAQEIMATHCITKALQDKMPSLLDEAEYWYRQAIAGGSKDAEHFFNVVWPGQKLYVLAMIGKKPGSGLNP